MSTRVDPLVDIIDMRSSLYLDATTQPSNVLALPTTTVKRRQQRAHRHSDGRLSSTNNPTHRTSASSSNSHDAHLMLNHGPDANIRRSKRTGALPPKLSTYDCFSDLDPGSIPHPPSTAPHTHSLHPNPEYHTPNNRRLPLMHDTFTSRDDDWEPSPRHLCRDGTRFRASDTGQASFARDFSTAGDHDLNHIATHCRDDSIHSLDVTGDELTPRKRCRNKGVQPKQRSVPTDPTDLNCALATRKVKMKVGQYSTQSGNLEQRVFELGLDSAYMMPDASLKRSVHSVDRDWMPPSAFSLSQSQRDNSMVQTLSPGTPQGRLHSGTSETDQALNGQFGTLPGDSPEADALTTRTDSDRLLTIAAESLKSLATVPKLEERFLSDSVRMEQLLSLTSTNASSHQFPSYGHDAPRFDDSHTVNARHSFPHMAAPDFQRRHSGTQPWSAPHSGLPTTGVHGPTPANPYSAQYAKMPCLPGYQLGRGNICSSTGVTANSSLSPKTSGYTPSYGYCPGSAAYGPRSSLSQVSHGPASGTYAQGPHSGSQHGPNSGTYNSCAAYGITPTLYPAFSGTVPPNSGGQRSNPAEIHPPCIATDSQPQSSGGASDCAPSSSHVDTVDTAHRQRNTSTLDHAMKGGEKGGGTAKGRPTVRKKRPGPISCRDKIWALFTREEQDSLLCNDMNAATATKRLLEMRAQQLGLTRIADLADDDDWGCGYKLTEAKATANPLDKPKSCSICQRPGTVFHRHSYYCRRCAQLYRAIHRKKNAECSLAVEGHATPSEDDLDTHAT